LAWILCAIKELACAINGFSSVFNRTRIKEVELQLVHIADEASTVYKYESGVPMSFLTLPEPGTGFTFSYIDTSTWVIYFTGPSTTAEDYTEKQTASIILI
jgi:hypothetical protein